MGQAIRRIDFAAGRERVAKRAQYEEGAKLIATALFAAEDSLENSALKMGLLRATLIETRRESGLSTVVGQNLVSAASHADIKVIEALDAIVQFHTAAQAQAEQLGVRMDFGGNKETVFGDPLGRAG